MKKLKINKIIISTNDDPKYIEFLPYVARAWKKLLGNDIEVIVGYASDKNNPEMEKHATVHRFWHPDIKSGNIAKVSRMLLACMHPNDYCLLSDMDMLPLQAEYFIEGSKRLRDDSVLFYSADAYTWQRMRFPICYILAKGRVFREFVNPNNLSENGLISLWTIAHYEDKSSLKSNIFSDESLLRWMMFSWKNSRIQTMDRGWVNNIAVNRIDRARFSIDREKMNRGEYIDCHMPRPLDKKAMAPLFDYLGINNGDN